MEYNNNLEIRVVRGDESETTLVKNSVSDDFLAGFHSIYIKPAWITGSSFQAVLFPDGPRWSGWSWNPRDPWVPYACLANHPNDSEAVNLHQAPTFTWDGTKSRLNYQWTKLDLDFQLKAIGLTMCDYYGETDCGVSGQPYACFPVQALAVLPQALTIKGRNGGSTVPDILQVSYYLSLIGV